MKKKKITIWLSLISTLFMLTSCGLFAEEEAPVDSKESTEQTNHSTEEQDTEEEVVEKDNQEDLTTWLPRPDDVVYHFEGIGNEYAGYTWNPQFNEEDDYQIVKDNGGTVVAEIYEYDVDAITRIFSRPETYFRDNFTEIGNFSENQEEEVILKAPIEVGTTWSNGESDYEITALDHELSVPAGEYTAMEVTITTDDTTTKKYYAKDVGLVSEVTETEGLTVESNLEKVETETPETLPFTVYVPDEQAMGMDTIEANLTLNTNDPARVAITELLSGQNTEYPEIKLLPEGTQINYLFLNDQQIVEADVSSEFVENMNAGSTGELFAIYTLVNTLSDYYGSQEVLLTVDGEPYEGAHMVLQEGETLQFDEEMVN
jgi:spore germination protein GerM